MAVRGHEFKAGTGFDYRCRTILAEEINGATACSGYDQLTVAGPADLDGSTLNMTLGYSPTLGTVFTIVNADSLTGTFNGIANNAVVASGATKFRVNYTATSVTLTVIETAAASGQLPATGFDVNAISLLFIVSLLGGGFALFITSRKRRRIEIV